MDKELIRTAIPNRRESSKSAGNNICTTSSAYNPIISQRLGDSPVDFLKSYNASRANNIIAKGYSSGQVALLPDIPSLSDVANKFGDETATKWLTILIDDVDNTTGTKMFPNEVRNEMASLLLAAYGNMNIGEILLFFARFKLGDFNHITSYVGGMQKITVALQHYRAMRNDDIIRIRREEENQLREQQRAQWAARAITYDEYLKTKDQ